MEARGDAGVREAGCPSQSEPESQASSEEVRVTFSREEYDRYSKRQEIPLKGLSLMPIEGLDAVSENWPADRKIQSKNPYFLRGLAVTYFYQSRMSKARELLLKVWEHVKDLDTALMLAECAFALTKPGGNCNNSGQGDTVAKAMRRVCWYVSCRPHITSKLIDEWNDRVKKSGRYMGYAILQYAWYCKVKKYRDRRGKGVVNARHLVHTVTKKIALNLLELQDKLMTPTLAYGLVCILEQMIKQLNEFEKTKRIRKHTYVTALCYNAIACLSMQYGSSKYAYNMTCEGAKKMNTNYSEARTERILYGDLNLNMGVAGYAHSQGRNKGYKKNFDEALSVYRSATEKITDSNRKRLIELVEENMRDAKANERE